MNWTGGHMKRFKGNNSQLSTKVRERYLLQQFIKKKESMKLKNKLQFNNQLMTTNQSLLSITNQTSSKLLPQMTPSSSSSTSSCRRLYRRINHPSDDPILGPKIHYVNQEDDDNINEEVEEDESIITSNAVNEQTMGQYFVDTDGHQRYFSEIMDQLLWRYEKR